MLWPAPGFADTRTGCFSNRVQAQVLRNLDVHQTVPRGWVRDFEGNPASAFRERAQSAERFFVRSQRIFANNLEGESPLSEAGRGASFRTI